MPINFLYPNPKKQEALDELNKLIEVLKRPKNPTTVKNVRILRNFTKSLFIVSHKKPSKKGLEAPKQLTQKYKPLTPLPSQKPIQKKKAPPLPPPPPPSSKSLSSPQKELKQENIAQLKEENGILKYDIIEPQMNQKDWQIYNTLEPIVKEQLKKDPNILTKPNFLTTQVKKIAKQLEIKYSIDYIKKLKYYLTKNIKGFGKLDPLIHDSRVKKIICNSFNELKVIFNDKMLPTNIKFDSNQELNHFILNIGSKYGKKPSETSPHLDLKLPNLQIIAEYNPITTSSFTITKK